MKSFLLNVALCLTFLTTASAQQAELPKDLEAAVLENARVVKEVTVDVIEVQEYTILGDTPFGFGPIFKEQALLFYSFDKDGKEVLLGSAPMVDVHHFKHVWKVFFKSHIVVAPTFRKVQTFIAPEPPKVDPAKEA